MKPPKRRNVPATGRLIGYARVSTDTQGADPQLDELRAAGCTIIHEEHASGADRGRPVLMRLLKEIRPGETLVVVRLDRLARSVSHLLAVIEQLETAGAHFRSLRDPIDTTTPQGMFSLQVLGAVAQLERALIAERTRAGLLAARSRGRIGGNPGLRARDPEAIRKIKKSRDAGYLNTVLAQVDAWLPTVRRMRPDQPWGDVVRVLNRGQATPAHHASGRIWTVERLRRTVHRLVAEGLADRTLLGRAPPQRSDDRLVRLVAGIKTAAPGHTLQQIATQLEAMRERTPRGGTRWHPSSVRHLLIRAERLGLLATPIDHTATTLQS
ncbi:recombinase family protein [Acidiphilium cryptum]|uniref:Resolvase, N-terminal domain n=1 Tax=Acidiphilium cryptum (strain JF-5) TaxID=349163 RepID=A5FU20_ACICJ|nr:recombinase family protein [Acidiphilium cryptum]ABQ29102.1 Resolvase, N-terminal domain [Acidiphilium cryptum JF-5]